MEAQGLVVRYRPELDPVLRGLSFKVRGCEKVGVCGRTGCGKSTLMMTLYRWVARGQGQQPGGHCSTPPVTLRDCQ